ncbi:MAG: hypothetical protein Fur0025_28260 [Oscillatoriaceae cyanobacterium]
MSRNLIDWLNKQSQRTQRLLPRAYEVWRTEGKRQTLAKLFKKLYLKLDNTPPPPPPPEPIPELPDPLIAYYHQWRQQYIPRPSDLQQMAQTVGTLIHQPRISVLMPIPPGTPSDLLRPAIESVLYQVYPHWELCLAPVDGNITSFWADNRIKIAYPPAMSSLVAASNAALARARGDLVLVLGHQDLIEPDALYEIALTWNLHPDADVIYSDEDKIDENNQLRDPFLKPDWGGNNGFFWGNNCHLVAYRKTLVVSSGGFRPECEESAEYDLLLRVASQTQSIFHIPKILYHGRMDSRANPPQPQLNPIRSAQQRAIADTIHSHSNTKQPLAPGIPSYEGDPEQPPHIRDYHHWLRQNFPRETDLQQMARTVNALAYKPTISAIVPVYNPPETYLKQAIESVINQIYPYWELCLADDASTAPHVRTILETYAAADPRIKVVFRTENGHISRASNSALEIATGEYIALLDHDDLLTPDAFYQVVLFLNQHPEADFIYSDEDKIDEENNLRDPFFKPQWSPDSFLSRMYVGHLGVYRRSIMEQIGGFRPGYDGSQDYDLVLRFTEKTDKIYHLPKILYHWRIHIQSAASSSDAKPYAYIAAKKAISEAIERRGEIGQVTDFPGYLGHYIIRYEIRDYKPVSIIIPTRDLSEMVDKCLTSIFTKTTYPNYQVILIDNGSTEPETAQLIDRWTTKEPQRFQCYRLDIPFNFSTINNYAVSKTKDDYLVFLNNDTEVITPDWLEAMMEQAQRPGIGAVGPLLLYPDNIIQHAGVVMGLGGLAAHSHQYLPATTPGYGGHVISISNVSAVTAACLMCRRSVFYDVGGFNEQLAFAYNDVDFCLKIVEKGYRNLYLPHVVLYHYESQSRGYEDTPEKQQRLQKEADIVKSQWQKYIDDDPCYSPHLTRGRADYSINI